MEWRESCAGKRERKSIEEREGTEKKEGKEKLKKRERKMQWKMEGQLERKCSGEKSGMEGKWCKGKREDVLPGKDKQGER